MEANEITEKVISYLREELLIKNKVINKTTTLSALGLDGDDVYELLMKFFKRFDIEYEDTNYLEFVPKESGFLFSIFNDIIGLQRKAIVKEIVVQDLVNSWLLKRWVK